MGKEFISDDTRRIFSLPARLGGLGFHDPCFMADLDYESSLAATSQLTNAIYHQQNYSDVVGFIRRRLRFDILRTCVIALRGFKKNAAPEKIEDLEFNLRPVAASY